MFSRGLKPVFRVIAQNGVKNFSTTSQANYKVTVCGAAGGIGQPLSLLLKQNCKITHLALYDIAKVTPGVAVDLSHMDTATKVTGHAGAESLSEAIKDADVVVIPAGVPRKPGMTRDDLFNTNASIVRDITECVSKCAPNAIIAIITNPVNSMVPIASEVMKKNGTYDPNRILGVTTLDIVRSRQFIGDINCVDPQSVQIDVIGGHSGVTIIPLLSRACPQPNLPDQAKIEALTKRIQEAGTEVVKAKAGGGSATLSMAWAAARITDSILRGLQGDANVVECAYVKSNLTEAAYFANPVLLGRCGVERNLGFGELNQYEQKLLKAAIPELLNNIKTGEDFAHKK